MEHTQSRENREGNSSSRESYRYDNDQSQKGRWHDGGGGQRHDRDVHGGSQPNRNGGGRGYGRGRGRFNGPYSGNVRDGFGRPSYPNTGTRNQEYVEGNDISNRSRHHDMRSEDHMRDASPDRSDRARPKDKQYEDHARDQSSDRSSNEQYIQGAECGTNNKSMNWNQGQFQNYQGNRGNSDQGYQQGYSNQDYYNYTGSQGQGRYGAYGNQQSSNLNYKHNKNWNQQEQYGYWDGNKQKEFPKDRRPRNRVENLDLKPLLSHVEATLVIHGTDFNSWEKSKLTGLSRMGRNHIHFAAGEPGENGVISEIRSSCEVMIYINLQKALEGGLKFFWSANNVILSPGNEDGVIPPAYFEAAVLRQGLDFDQNVTITRVAVGGESLAQGKSKKKKKEKGKGGDEGTEKKSKKEKNEIYDSAIDDTGSLFNEEKIEVQEEDVQRVVEKMEEKIEGQEEDVQRVVEKKEEKIEGQEENVQRVVEKKEEKIEGQEENVQRVVEKKEEKTEVEEKNVQRVVEKMEEKIEGQEENVQRVVEKMEGKIEGQEENVQRVVEKMEEKIEGQDENVQRVVEKMEEKIESQEENVQRVVEKKEEKIEGQEEDVQRVVEKKEEKIEVDEENVQRVVEKMEEKIEVQEENVEKMEVTEQKVPEKWDEVTEQKAPEKLDEVAEQKAPERWDKDEDYEDAVQDQDDEYQEIEDGSDVTDEPIVIEHAPASVSAVDYLNDQEIVAVYCDQSEDTFNKIVCAVSDRFYIFDIQKTPDIMSEGKLAEFFNNSQKPCKVFHGLTSRICATFFEKFEIILDGTKIFDLKIAYDIMNTQGLGNMTELKQTRYDPKRVPTSLESCDVMAYLKGFQYFDKVMKNETKDYKKQLFKMVNADICDEQMKKLKNQRKKDLKKFKNRHPPKAKRKKKKRTIVENK